jgi:SAM-dependent methyltransferase
MSLLDRIRARIEMRKWDASFARFQRENPGASFGHFYAANALAKINEGKPISTLGPRLRDGNDGVERHFGTAGGDAFRKISERFQIQPHHRVVDYGCGSFMTGIHFIRALAPGNYLGLDVTPSFIEMGRDLIGEALLVEKQPHLDTISERSLAAAADFQADFVVSNAVAYHVHPAELPAYCRNLVQITAKHGSRLVFDVRLSEPGQRYRLAGWAWALAKFIELLSPLVFVSAHDSRAFTRAPVQRSPITAAVLEFRRA